MTDDRPKPAAPGAQQRGCEPLPLWRTLVGDQLRTGRLDAGETQAAVARRASVSTQYLSEVERGRKEPSSEVLAALAQALGMTLLDLTLAVAGELQHAAARAGGRGGFSLAA